MSYVYGHIKDVEDTRDYKWSEAFAGLPIKTPSSFVLNDLGPVLNQGASSMCVAYTMASIKMEEEYRETQNYWSFDPADLYRQCKQIDGMPDMEGTVIRVAMKIVQSQGMLGKLADKSDRFKISNYVRLTSISDIKQALSTVGAVAFGTQVDTSIEEVNGDYIPLPTGNSAGGHCMTIAGYDDNKACDYLWNSPGAFLIKNSWGEPWGNKGYAWMPYGHLNVYPGWDCWRAIDMQNTQKYFANSDG